MQIVALRGTGDYKIFLDNPRKAHKVEVFVLKDYLRDRLNVEFRPRKST